MDATSRSANPYLRASQEIYTPRDLLQSRSATQAARSLRNYTNAVPNDDVIYGRLDLVFRAQAQGRSVKSGTIIDIQA